MTENPELYLELIAWIFNGHWHSRSYLKPLSTEQRVDWLRTYLPKTYALLAVNHQWAALSDL